jgi:CheY-like chemotaxis protein
MLQETGRFPRREASPPKLILLVEDDPANAQFFLHILTQEASFRVFWATNGRAALHFTEHVKPQLFLLEDCLPDMHSIILHDRLHARKELEGSCAHHRGLFEGGRSCSQMTGAAGRGELVRPGRVPLSH